MKGIITKGIAGFFFVESGEETYRCKARGIFKQQGIRPAVGDEVEFEIIEGNDDSIITEILPRRNVFIRPFLANVECFAIVTSVARPAPILRTIDRFLVMAEKADADIIVCINKVDLAGVGKEGKLKSSERKAAENLETLKETYSPIYPVVEINGLTGDGIDSLKELIAGKRTALAGASGAGKSSILNCLHPDAFMETGSVSEKTSRGRHTTRHAEIFRIPDGRGSLVFDTPGFTSFDILEADEEELYLFFPEMAKFAGACRYDNCRHLAEPGCAIKEALQRGEINSERYESYKAMIEEIRKASQY